MAGISGQILVEEIPEDEIQRLVQKGFKGYTKLVKFTPGGIIMSPRYAEVANKIRDFEFRPEDCVVMTYPKSGTTWLQETIWAMRNIHQLHFAEKEPIDLRSYFIDADGLYSLNRQLSMKSQMERFRSECPGKNPEDGIVLQLAGASRTPRIIKTHLPISLYPRSILDVCKVVYVCRDPRDVCVSYYHHCRLINTYQFEGTFDDFAETFMGDDLFYGSYWQHVAAAWQMRNHPNFHFMFYEDLQNDPITQMNLLREFLGCPLSDKQLEKVVHHSSFNNMKQRHKLVPMTFSSTTNVSQESFYRKGIVGDWMNVASKGLDSQMSLWIQQQASTVDPKFDKYS